MEDTKLSARIRPLEAFVAANPELYRTPVALLALLGLRLPPAYRRDRSGTCCRDLNLRQFQLGHAQFGMFGIKDQLAKVRGLESAYLFRKLIEGPADPSL